MDQYLKQLLSQQTRAIIPGLGAFINSPEGGMMFNQYLNFDDNALVAHVAQQANISEDEARQQVTDYSNSLRQRLDAGEKVDIEGVGSLSKNGDMFVFEAAEGAINNATATSTTIDLSNAEPSAAETTTSIPKATATTSTTNTFVYEEDHSARNIFLIILIALLFLIGVVICLFVVNKDNCVYNFFFGEKEPVEQVEIVPTDTITTVAKPDTVVVAQPVEEPAPQIKRDKRYNIIVGTYKNEQIAQKRVDALKAKGFENASVGTFRGNYVAIIDSYNSLPEAEAKQEYIVDTYRIESYITNSGE